MIYTDENRIRKAMEGALGKRGKYKGHLKRQCPKMGTDAAIFWQAAQMVINPYKVSIGQFMFMSPSEMAFAKECEHFVEHALHSSVRKVLDLDAYKLKELGAW